VEVTSLLPAGASPHTFEPTPKQVRALADARVFVCVGAGLDTWATKLLAAHREALRMVTITDGLALLGSEHGHAGDPHVWLDPVLMRDHAVPAIVTALSQADPEHRDAFAAAAAALQAALSQLDGEIRSALVPIRNRGYIAFHAAWQYFARRYDLREVAVVETFPGKEPSAREIATIVRAAQASGVRCLLVEPQFSARRAEQIAAEFGGRTALVDPLGGPDVVGRNHYLALMRYNLRAFVEAMQ
jgi:ABC-type Zn uptake system ZnuABC Zn-binding protein ZnuA